MTQETRSIPFTRLHHALNGQEVRDIIMRQLKAALDRDKRFNVSNTFPLISWNVMVDVTAQPRENPNLFVQVAAGAMEVDGDGNAVDGPHGEFQFTVRTGQGFNSASDEVREQNGLKSPMAMRTEGLPISEEDADRRQVVIPENDDAVEAVARMRVQNSPLARKLQAAHVGRPHKVVETSPLAAEHERRNLGVAEERPSREPTHALDPRMDRTVEGIPTGKPPDDPRHKMVDPMKQQVTIGKPSREVSAPEKVETEPQDKAGTFVADPREDDAINYAATVEIKPDSEHAARAQELKERAATRREDGEDLSVKMADESVERRGKDDIPSAAEPPNPPDPAPRG